MNAILLNNETLRSFIELANIGQDQKGILISKLPQMDLEERTELFKTLTNIYLLHFKKEAAIQQLNKNK